MKKVGAKPGQLVRSASRRGKTPARFQFDVTVERVFGTLPRAGGSYYVKWARGVKVAQTRPVTAAKEHLGGSRVTGGVPFGEKLSLLVTLYRLGDGTFDEKDTKVALISASPKGEKTVAKAHFDLSAYAGVPSASATKVLKLSDKASVKLAIDARLVKAGKRTGSGGASSALSGMTAASGMSSDPEDEDDDADMDFSPADVPEPEAPPRARRLSSAAARRQPSSGARSPAPGGRAAASPANGDGTPRKTASRGWAPAGAGSGAGSGVGSGSADREELVRLRAEVEEVARLRAEVGAAREEKEGLRLEVKRAVDKRKRMEAAHGAEVDALKVQVAAGSAGGEREVSAERRRAEEAAAKLEKVQEELASAMAERNAARRENAPYKAAARDADALREENKKLARDVADMAGGGGDEALQRRLQQLMEEKEVSATKLAAHERHAEKVRTTYRELTEMYNTLRDENVDLTAKVEDLTDELAEANRAVGDAERKALDASAAASEVASKASRVASRDSVPKGIGGVAGGGAAEAALRDEVDRLEQELGDVRAGLRAAQESKASLVRDEERSGAQLHALQDRLDRLCEERDETRKEADELASKIAEITAQRDSAVARAEKAGESASSRSVAAANEAKLAEAMKSREHAERELARVNQRVSELEREVGDITEDLDYEKAEKAKAREERDALRESARALERRTSQVSQTADTVHALKRQLSTHKMRESDQAAMIADLRGEVDELQTQLDKGGGASGNGDSLYQSASRDEGQVIEDLVMAKLALANAEDEKLQLQFKMKEQRKSEKAVQERLAAHASRLEVKLAEANDELGRVRALRNSEDEGSLV